jgi:undecaprenyl-diphosphatase
MDQNIFFAINGLVGKWQWLDSIGRFIGGDYFLFLFSLVIVVLVFDKEMRKRVFLLFGSVFLSRIVITDSLKRYYNQPRPYEVLDVHRLSTEQEIGNSFPSGHATIYFSMAFIFWGTKYFWPFLALAILGSIGRIFIGMHYPLDVLVGALVGTMTSLVLLLLFKNWISR